jgi:hypothetical protein
MPAAANEPYGRAAENEPFRRATDANHADGREATDCGRTRSEWFIPPFSTSRLRILTPAYTGVTPSG